jgi:type II secretory pathway predicted ATPase ExeA
MLHRHTAHNEAVARIGWCTAERRIGVITGEVGAGKTVAVRAALAALDRSRHSVIYLPDPTVGVRGIHHRIVAALGGQPLTHHATLAPQAADALATEHAERGRTAVIVVEEAHLLGHDQLEAIRLLTNHDLDSSSPFACLLVGQPTLRRRMKLGVLAALDQRIGLRYAMPPMTDKETASYLHHHLALAGRDDTLFSDDAVALIHQTSRGYLARSTTSPCKPSLPRSAPTRPSSTNPQPAQPSPKSRQTEHHPDTPNSTDPAGHQPAGSFHAHTSPPSTPPSCPSLVPVNSQQPKPGP